MYNVDDDCYNTLGQRVSKNAKGLIIYTWANVIISASFSLLNICLNENMFVSLPSLIYIVMGTNV